MISPYFDDGTVQLYHGRLEDVIPQLRAEVDLIVADPPYAETSLSWDQWPDGWPGFLAEQGVGASMWVFGSMRMFLDRRSEFAAWKHGQDVVWEKNAPSFNPGDRFSRIHECAVHWYRGRWDDVHHVPERVPARTARAGQTIRRSAMAPNIQGERGASTVTLDGLAYRTSVLYAPNVRGGINPTQKPEGILTPLITYGCPPGGARPRPVRRIRLHPDRRPEHRPTRDRDRGPGGAVRVRGAAARAGRPRVRVSRRARQSLTDKRVR